MGREEDIARIRVLRDTIVSAEARQAGASRLEEPVILEEIRVARVEATALAGGGRYICTPGRPWSMSIDPSGRAVHPDAPEDGRCPNCNSPWVGLVPVDRGGQIVNGGRR